MTPNTKHQHQKPPRRKTLIADPMLWMVIAAAVVVIGTVVFWMRQTPPRTLVSDAAARAAFTVVFNTSGTPGSGARHAIARLRVRSCWLLPPLPTGEWVGCRVQYQGHVAPVGFQRLNGQWHVTGPAPLPSAMQAEASHLIGAPAAPPQHDRH